MSGLELVTWSVTKRRDHGLLGMMGSHGCWAALGGVKAKSPMVSLQK